MKPLRVLVLDFDGVILDSNVAKTRAFERLFAQDPAHQTDLLEYHLQNFSAPRRQKIEHWVYEVLGRPGDEGLVERRLVEYGRLVAAELARAPLVPGAFELLQEFSPKVPIYIASVTPEAELRDTLSRLGLAAYIKSAFGDPPTPKVQALREIIRREAVAASDILFIGDQPSDQAAALAAGVPFLPRDSGTPFTKPHAPPVNDLRAALGLLRPRTRSS